MSYLLGRLASGERVFDRAKEPYTKTKSDLLPLIKEALDQIQADGQDRLSATVDLGREIGLDYCVSATPQQKEQIYYAQIVGRRGYSRFISGVKPSPTTYLTIVLNKRIYAKKKGYNLVVAKPGKEFPVEPWKSSVVKEFSLADHDFGKKVWQFWKTHAFAEGYKPIVSSTKTKKLPWRPPY